MPQFASQVQIHSVEVNERYLAITFTDSNDVVKGVADTTTRVIATEMFPDDIAEIIDSLQQLVDEAAVVKRNPPDRLSRGG